MTVGRGASGASGGRGEREVRGAPRGAGEAVGPVRSGGSVGSAGAVGPYGPGETASISHWPGVEDVIRDGRGPDDALIGQLADAVLELGAEGAAAAGTELRERVLGFGPLERFVDQPGVTDILVNGDGSVWLDSGDGLGRTDVTLSPPDARALATRLSGRARRRLDEAQPWVDAVLPGGVRLHAILPPLAEGGTHLSLRIPRAQPVGVDGLQALGSVNAEMARVLRGIVSSRASLLVVGGTGAGKTTVLGALLSECSPGERLVVVEDVRELAPEHPHVVRLQGRAPNVEGAGSVTLVDLVRQALRMRPDRLVVGEVRGAEVRELLAALNTGHEGGAGTLHANGPSETPARLEALGALAGLGREAVHAQLRGALQVVIDVARVTGRRHVRSIGVTRWSGDEVVIDTALTARPMTGRPGDFVVTRGPGWSRLVDLIDGSGLGAEVGAA